MSSIFTSLAILAQHNAGSGCRANRSRPSHDSALFFIKQFSLISPSEFPRITVGNSLFWAGLFVAGIKPCHLDA